MKKVLAVFAFVFGLFSASAHEFYFAFGEVEYNEVSGKLEITLEISAHDLEADMKKAGIVLTKHLENQSGNPEFKKQLLTHLEKGFELSNNGSVIPLHLLGFDVMPTGLLYVYLESDPLKLTSSLTFKFDLLMESFPDQQNKITFIYKKEKQTAVFLPTKRTEIISL